MSVRLPRPRWVASVRLDVVILILVAVASRVGLAVLGRGMEMSAVEAGPGAHSMQLLATAWLRHDLLHSVGSLTMQPPLYNLAIGVLLALPHTVITPAAGLWFFGCSIVIALSTFGSMVLLGVARRVAFFVTLVLVVLDPAQLLFSTHLFYATPTAALMGATTFLGIWALSKPSWRRSLAFAATGSSLALFNTMVQPLVLLILLAVLVLALRPWRRVLVVGMVVPCLVLCAWVGLSIARVGTPATSTWFGMNLAHGVLRPADPLLIESMVANGQLSPLALVKPFSSLAASGVAPVHAGPRASAAATRPDGLPNLNNRAYAEVSSRYLTDSVTFIEHHPGAYLATVWAGLKLWAVPSDQFYFFYRRTSTATWEVAYDAMPMLQIRHDQDLSMALWQRKTVSVSQVSWLLVLETLGDVLGGAIVIGRWRSLRRRWAAAVAVPWFLATQAFVVSALTEYGENNRFRFECSVPLLIVATVVGTLVSERVRRRPSDQGLAGRLDSLGWVDRPSIADGEISTPST